MYGELDGLETNLEGGLDTLHRTRPSGGEVEALSIKPSGLLASDSLNHLRFLRVLDLDCRLLKSGAMSHCSFLFCITSFSCISLVS